MVHKVKRMRKCLLNLFCFLSLVFVFSILCLYGNVSAVNQINTYLNDNTFEWYLQDVNGDATPGFVPLSYRWARTIQAGVTSYFKNFQLKIYTQYLPGISDVNGNDLGVTIRFRSPGVVTRNPLNSSMVGCDACVAKNLYYSSNDVSFVVDFNGTVPAMINLYSADWGAKSFLYYNNSNEPVDMLVGVAEVSVYYYTDDGSQVIVDAIGNLNATQNQTNQQLDEVTSAIDQTNLLLQQQSEDDQSQYEQEKQEEAERENELDGDSSQAQGVFSFSVFNPFLPLFSMFNVNQCVSIPTLSNMLGSSETQYCSWFNGTTRGILTPVMSIASVMLIFGFVIRWLGGSSIITFGGKV